MAINLQEKDQRQQLQRAVRYHFEYAQPSRERRKNLIDIFSDRSTAKDILGDNHEEDTIVNYFQKFVRGHMLTVAYGNPKWSVKARTREGRGFDARVQLFLDRYSELLELYRVFRQAAVDSAFGNAVIKVISSIAPKGIHSAVAPRAFRINPDHLIIDQSAHRPEEASFIGDVYLVPLSEARAHFGPDKAHLITPYRRSSDGSAMIPDDMGLDRDVFAEPMARLVDIFLPTSGQIVTWNAATDTFSEIGDDEALQVIDTPINPYEILQLTPLPDRLEEFARLSTLKGLHFIANDSWQKAAKQMRRSRRNPIDKMGNAQDLDTLATSGESEPIYLEDPSTLDIFTIPGPDGAVVNFGQFAGQQFSLEAGNLEVALGQSTGASTARQTQALIGQISASQSLDRDAFEKFMAGVGKKLASLAFASEILELEATTQVPGTRYEYNFGWAPPEKLPRPATVDEFFFGVVPYSASSRSPEERLSQLEVASQAVLRWMLAAAQGVPVNIGAVITSYAESLDLVNDLEEWWTKEEPTPQEKTGDTYSSLADQKTGSTLTYDGNGGGGGDGGSSIPVQQGGFSSG